MSQRFTVSLHRVGPQNSELDGRGDHLDWFFDVGHNQSSGLVTWSTTTCWRLQSTSPARRLTTHRARYLDYDGGISGDRGHAQRLVSGLYLLGANDDVRFTFAVESVAMVEMPTASAVDHDARRIAAQLYEQLNASLGESIRFFA